MKNETVFPFGADPTEEQIVNALEQIGIVYEGCPETTCCSKAECCNAGCPNMYFNEFLNIRRGAVDKMTPAQRTELTVECVKRYLQDQRKPKPCVFLQKDNLCSIYKHRHFKCRTYGIIPPSLYDWIANAVAMEMGVERKDVPLCTQCPDVKIKPEFKEKYPDNSILESEIKKMEKRLREIDRTMLGMKKEVQDQGMSFLTYHDWHLLFEFGEIWMENLTKLRLSLTDEKKEQFIVALKSALDAKAAQASGEEAQDAK